MSRPLTVRRLLSSAVRAFAEHGFEGTTTRQICAGAGLSSAALYVYFGSKEDLFYEISIAGHEGALAALREAIKATDEPAERLWAAVHAFVLYHAEHYTLARVIQYELRELSAEHLSAILPIRREIDRALRASIDAGVRAGRFACTDVGGSALAIESLAIDVARWFDPSRSSRTPAELAALYADFALRIVQSDRA
jgi:AcrR family transcriptional regulator